MICLISAFNKPNKSILLFLFVVVFAGVMASAFNISIGLNLTASMPKGFYFLVSKDRVVAGDLVSSCISSDAIDLPTYKERNYIAKSNVCDSGLAEEIKNILDCLNILVKPENMMFNCNGKNVIVSSGDYSGNDVEYKLNKE
jgi:hypothetical protein